MNEYFERFARKICEFCMKNYVIPYLEQHGYIMSYRATIVDKNTSNQTMTVQRPFDNSVVIPYSDSASGLTASAGNNQCTVFCLGSSTNSIVVSDGKLSTL